MFQTALCGAILAQPVQVVRGLSRIDVGGGGGDCGAVGKQETPADSGGSVASLHELPMVNLGMEAAKLPLSCPCPCPCSSIGVNVVPARNFAFEISAGRAGLKLNLAPSHSARSNANAS